MQDPIADRDYRYPVDVDEKYGFINGLGELVIEPRYDSAGSFCDGLAEVAIVESERQTDPLTGLYRCRVGFINPAGEEMVPLEYRFARSFREGFAAVLVDKKWGFLNAQGMMIIEPQYDAAFEFTEGLAPVDVGRSLKRMIDTSGQTVFEIEATALGQCSEGLIPCLRGNKWCFLDRAGNVALEVVCKALNGFSESRASALKKDMCGFIDHEGHWVIPPQFPQTNNFHEGLCSVELDRSVNGETDYSQPQRFGYIDRHGQWIIGAQFGYAAPFSSGLAAVMWDKSEHYGYINTEGQTIIEPLRASFAEAFEGPLACLQDADDGSRWYINRKGEYVWPN